MMPTLIDGLAGVTVIDDKAYANPLRLSTCGLVLALSVKVTAPVRVPIAAGANFTVITQLAPDARELGHVLVLIKSPVATATILERLPLPMLVTVAVCAELVDPTSWRLKVRPVGDSVTGGVFPVPERAIAWGLFAAASIAVKAPLSDAAVCGENTTLITQLAPAANVTGQLLF